MGRNNGTNQRERVQESERKNEVFSYRSEQNNNGNGKNVSNKRYQTTTEETNLQKNIEGGMSPRKRPLSFDLLVSLTQG